MNVALAQVSSVRGDIEENIQKHVAWISRAVREAADLIVFPELSLSGYHPSMAADLAVDPGDTRLGLFRSISMKSKITIALGLPLKESGGVLIGMLFFQPDGSVLSYSKQQLHRDEEPFFQHGKGQILLDINGRCVAPAICYESLQPEHADWAVSMGAKVYVASVAKPQDSLKNANDYYSHLASRLDLSVLLVNSVGPQEDFISGGGSAAWTKHGQLKGKLDANEEGLLFVNLFE